jgi:phosphopantothenoylcysteine synthetase/decarboxylase
MSLTFLITSGPTREYLDPVRYLSNASSGRMGHELAREALRRKHRVIVVSGPSEIAPPRGAACERVVSAREMFAAVKKHLKKADIVIGAAAVADYRPRTRARHKLKKAGKTACLELIPNPDILAYVGRRKERQVAVGFALESKDILRSAREKMREKRLDLIIANPPASIGGGRTSAWLLFRDGTVLPVPATEKRKLARRIVDEAVRCAKDHRAG